MEIKLAIFFNNYRGFEVYKKISKHYITDVFLTNKNLNPEIKKLLINKKIKFKIIDVIDNKILEYLKKKK